MVRGLFMPLGRVILAASEAMVRGQASRNSSATNIAICLIEDQILFGWGLPSFSPAKASPGRTGGRNYHYYCGIQSILS